MKTSRRWGMGLAIVSVLGLAWPGVARAQSDKQVVIYSANESTLDGLVFSAFEKETGIKVQPVAAGSGVLVKRIVSEKDRPQGDVIWGISRSLLETNRAYFAPYRSRHHDAIPAGYRDPDTLWIGNNLHLMVILQNTKLVPAEQGPASRSAPGDPRDHHGRL
jgi:iron(III) transport system substrate-binding protein